MRLTQLVDDGAIGDVRTVQAEFAFTADPGGSGRLRDPGAAWRRAAGHRRLPAGLRPAAAGHAGHRPGLGADRRRRRGRQHRHRARTPGRGARRAVLLDRLDGAQRAEIGGTLGRIEIPRDFYRPDSFVLHRRGHEPEEFRFPREAGHGYRYEAAEVMRCLRAGAVESPLVPLDGTLAVMATLDTVRRRIGLRYPGDRD